MADAAAAPPETPLPSAADPAHAEEEEQCRICRFPAEADRPLRSPCACRGSIQFVHDECQFQWMAMRHQHECEVCKRLIRTRPIYATDAPARLPLQVFMLGAPNRIMGLLLTLFFTVSVVYESIVRLTTLWTWRVAFARTFAQVYHQLSLCLSTTSIVALMALWILLAQKFRPSAVAPFRRWIQRLEDRLHGLRGFDGLQAVAIVAIECLLWVLVGDMALAFIFGFLPFSLGRIILWCMSCFNFGIGDELDSYTSTASILLIGYRFMFSAGATFAGLNTFRQYLTGKRLMISIFFTSPRGTLFRGIVYLITLANISLNGLNPAILQEPLLFGWLVDICTSNMFGATMSERFELLTASSFSSNALHWLIGNTILRLRLNLPEILHQILRPGVPIPIVRYSFREPFYKFHFKRLRRICFRTIFIVLVILVPIEIVVQLAPEVFPLDITFFDRPAKGTPFWQGLRYCAESLSVIYHLKFLIGNMLLYLEWLLERVTLYWFVTTGEALGNNDTPKDQYGSSGEVNDKRRTIPRVILAWLAAVVIFNSAMFFFSISVGRRFLFAIPQFPVAGRMKSNDLFAVSVGFCIISTIIAAARDSFACMTSGGTRLFALEMHLLYFIWIFIIPLLIGLLVDLTLMSPFTGPDDDVPALGFFCTLFLGRQLQNIGNHLAPRTRFSPYLPFVAYFVNEDRDRNLRSAKELLTSVKLTRLLRDELLPVATKLLTALGVPYVLAKCIFPRLGYSVAANSTVYHFAWLGSLTLYVLCVKLHGSIRNDRYAIGRRLEDFADTCWKIQLLGLFFE